MLYHQPSRSLRSSSQSLLHVPRAKTDFGRRVFSSAGSQIWNYILDSSPQNTLFNIAIIFTVRRSALHGLCGRNSVRPSVRLSVCPSVTLVNCVHMVRPTIMISSPYGSPIILLSGDITFIPKFEGGHPERGR